MEYGPDGEPTTDVRFIASYTEVFSSDEVVLPKENCNLVAVAPKYGLVFVGCRIFFKVFTTKTLTEGKEKTPLTTVNTGAPITHVAASCDGLTLVVTIIHNDGPHALFYEVRSFTPGCEEQVPFASVILSEVGGSRVQGLAWNPADPNSVAVAVSPSLLAVVTLRESQIDIKTEKVPARAVGWSPKGKQLTVGLTDGSLTLFKPDLTVVRNVPQPPMNGIGSVLSITWFTNTEFFISYKSELEEGAHVMMYVNAPKAKDPKFITYDYLCNYNQGPRPPMFYPAFFPEWSLLCLLSSRAIQVAVLGKVEAGAGEGWCEYEIEEGGCAEIHIMSITDETFPLGLAVDFTSQKVFTNKDETTSGPFPVIYTLSTGGELNIFHLVNSKAGVEQLTKPLENLPVNGHRTLQQYKGAASYTVPKSGMNPSLLSSSTAGGISSLTKSLFSTNTTTFAASTPTSSSTPASASTAAPGATGAPFSFSSTGVYKSPTSEQQSGPSGGSQTSSFTKQGHNENVKHSFSFSLTSGSPFAALPASNTSSSSSSSNLFGGGKLPSLQSAKPSLQPETPSGVPQSGVQTCGAGAVSADSLGNIALQHNETSNSQHPQASVGQGLKFPTFQLPQANTATGSISQGKPQASTATGSISQGKPALNPINSQAFKPTAVKLGGTCNSKPASSQTSSKAQSPAPAARPLSSLSNTDATLLATITSATSQFEEELKNHLNLSGLHNKIGSKEEMEEVRVNVSKVCEWTGLMEGTTSELKGEVTQLHSEILEGYTLAEEAKVHMNKNKNPRNNLMPQLRPLDPHNRRKLEEIRSLYQYLQSQLVEVETRLHLDWAAFTNDRNKKKKHELPASETLYQALKKCHNLRRLCERRVDAVCDRIKMLNLNYLSGLSTSRSHYDDEETLASLEKSLREATISPNVSSSPFKMLSPEKQDKLERVLSQRQVIPIRKCASIPKADLTCVDTLSSLCSQDGSPASSSPTIQQSFSFGPETFSTPNKNDVKVADNSVPSGTMDILVQNASSTAWGASNNNLLVTGAAVQDKVPHFSPAPSYGAKEQVKTLTTKAQYEDITPPQTPDSKLETGLKTASPLLALSSLVSKVPTTTGVDNKVPARTSPVDAKPAIEDSFGSIPVGGMKTQIIVTSVPAMTNFTFKPVTSAPSLQATTVEASNPFTFTPFVQTVSTSFGSVAGTVTTLTQQAKSTHSINSIIVCKAPSTTVSFMSSAPPITSINHSGLFSFKPPASGVIISKTFSAGGNSSVSKLSSQSEAVADSSTPQLPISSCITGISHTSDETAGTESDSTSSSGESDTASNNTVVADNASSGTSDSTEGQETATDDTLEKQVPSKTLGGIDLLSQSVALASQSESSVSSGQSLTLNALLKKSSETNLSVSNSSLLSQKTATVTDSIFSTSGMVSNSMVDCTKSSTFSSNAEPTTTPSGLFGDSLKTSAASTGGSFFGTLTSTTAGSIFGTATTTSLHGSILGTAVSGTTTGGLSKATTTVTTAEGLFGSAGGNLFGITVTSGSIFGTTCTTSSSGSIFGNKATTLAGSIFGATSPSTSSTSAIFETATAATMAGNTVETTSATSGSIFGSTTTTSGSLFGTTSTATKSIFGATTTTTGSIFSVSTSTTGSIFGATATTTGGIFTTTTPSSGSLFGSTKTTTSNTLFGGPSSNSGSLFGSASASHGSSSGSADPASTSVTTASAGGTSVATPQSPSLSFSQSFSPENGSVSSSSSVTHSIFGGSVSTSVPSTGLFSTATSSGPIFGQPSTFTALSTSSSGSAFSSLNSPSSAFAVPATTSATSSGMSVFGQTAPQSSSSVFTKGAQSPQGSVFSSGGQSGSVFGNQTSNTGLFSGSATQSAGSSVFGQQAVNNAGFGSGTTGGTVFGQTSTAASPFSSASSSKQDSSLFGAVSFGTGSGTGTGFFTGLGSKPSGDSANKNVFGSTVSSENKTQSNLFGGNSTNSSPFGSDVFGGSGSSGGTSGSFSTGSGSVAQSGFAVPSARSPSGFGGGPVFGGGATLGTTSAFGGAATFGSPSKLGSSTFGGSATFSPPLASSASGESFGGFASQGGSTFGSIASSSSTVAASSGFSSFASQGNTASFGGLAQQSANQQQSGSPFGSGANVFGSGSNFSSWR